jgi:hypothetical protein
MLPLRVQQVSFAIAFEDFAKHPAVTVKIGKLRVRKQRVECRRAGVFQKIEVGPQAAQARAFRIAIEFLLLFILTRIVLLAGYILRRRSRCPTRSAEITRDHVRARVHVTDHALRRRNLAGELMLDRMARFVFGMLISGLRASEISGLLVESRMRWIAIVCVDHVTGGTTRRTIVARMIVCAEKVQRRIEQPRFL